MNAETDTELGLPEPVGPGLPLLTHFYGGEMTRQRVNRESDRLVAFARFLKHRDGVTDGEFRLWLDGLEEWRNHWLQVCTG